MQVNSLSNVPIYCRKPICLVEWIFVKKGITLRARFGHGIGVFALLGMTRRFLMIIIFLLIFAFTFAFWFVVIFALIAVGIIVAIFIITICLTDGVAVIRATSVWSLMM